MSTTVAGAAARLAELEARRESIAGELEEARESAREARAAVVGGSASTDTLTAPQARVLALEATLAEVDGELDRLRELAAAEANAAARAERFEEAAEAARAASTALAAMEKARAAADRTLRQHAARIIEARAEHDAAHRAFRAAVAALSGARLNLSSERLSEDERAAVDAVVAELGAAGVKLDAVQMDQSGRAYGYGQRPIRLAELPTAGAIAGAVQVVAELQRRGR